MYRTPEEHARVESARNSYHLRCACSPTQSPALHAQQHGRALRSPEWHAAQGRYHTRRRIALSMLAGAVLVVAGACIAVLYVIVGGQ